MMQMEEDQKVSDYFSKITEIVNLMKNYGENISHQMVVEKVLRSLSQKFDFIVVAIQEAKDVKTMKIEELQSSLEAHELLVIDRSSERSDQQALQAQTIKKEGNSKNFKKGKGKSNWSNNGKSRAKNKTESSKRGGFVKNQNKKKDFDESKKDQKTEEANIAHEGDLDAVLLMAATCEDKMKGEEWYLDSGCSNHMTTHREWLTNFDASKKTSIKLADNRKLAAEGSGNIVIKSNFGGKIIIEDYPLPPGQPQVPVNAIAQQVQHQPPVDKCSK
ncbi:uncharacterized protein [Medicago truncatula]|uniref:uncharacterized protein n=1 Tax=Medicago truncatula TaxID=3880 RepID=UPI0019689FD2|nr:uncharacterized protein LOC112418103 [Medicago truncatula]